MSDDLEIEDEWDFYQCEVNDQPASILINLRYMFVDPKDENDHVYHALLVMKDPGPQGVGSQAEMERLSPIDDAVFDRAEKAGAEPVGRVRGEGFWRLSVYGPKDLPWAAWIAELAGAEVEVQTELDSDFNYVNDILLPDAERHQWIMDRRVCDQLLKHEDDPTLPRLVNHFIDYEGDAPQPLIEAIRGLGFDVNDSGSSLECTKLHDTQVDTAHEVAMTLIELADQYDAAYDGWGAPVTKATAGVN